MEAGEALILKLLSFFGKLDFCVFAAGAKVVFDGSEQGDVNDLNEVLIHLEEGAGGTWSNS